MEKMKHLETSRQIPLKSCSNMFPLSFVSLTICGFDFYLKKLRRSIRVRGQFYYKYILNIELSMAFYMVNHYANCIKVMQRMMQASPLLLHWNAKTFSNVFKLSDGVRQIEVNFHLCYMPSDLRCRLRQMCMEIIFYGSNTVLTWPSLLGIQGSCTFVKKIS